MTGPADDPADNPARPGGDGEAPWPAPEPPAPVDPPRSPYAPPGGSVPPPGPIGPGAPPYPSYPGGPGGPGGPNRAGPPPRPGLTRGVLLSLGVHGLLAASVVGLAFDDSGLDPFWAVPVSLAVLAIGIGLAVARRQTRLGEGLILGWLISLTLVPLVLFGVCVAYLQNNQL